VLWVSWLGGGGVGGGGGGGGGGGNCLQAAEAGAAGKNALPPPPPSPPNVRGRDRFLCSDIYHPTASRVRDFFSDKRTIVTVSISAAARGESI